MKEKIVREQIRIKCDLDLFGFRVVKSFFFAFNWKLFTNQTSVKLRNLNLYHKLLNILDCEILIKSSHHSSMVSMVDCYQGGLGFKSRQGRFYDKYSQTVKRVLNMLNGRVTW